MVDFSQTRIETVIQGLRPMYGSCEMDAGVTLISEMSDEIERLRDGIDAIRQYGSDTLRGPTESADDTRAWQRDCVLEMTNRAVRILDGRPWQTDSTKEGK